MPPLKKYDSKEPKYFGPIILLLLISIVFLVVIVYLTRLGFGGIGIL